MNGITSSDKRVLITYSPSFISSQCLENSEGLLLHLRGPKSGETTCYVLMDGILQELQWFKRRYGSWFLGNYVLQDGSLYMCSPVDPIFLALPVLDGARMKKGDDQGKFRQLGDIFFIEGYPGYTHLLPLLAYSLEAVCEVQEVGSSRFYRLDDRKVLAWLCCKFKYTLEGLELSDGFFQGFSEAEKKTYAVDLLGDYLKATPWLDMLCAHLGVDLEASKKARSVDSFDSVLPCISKSNPATKEANFSSGKLKATKKGHLPACHKMSEFFSYKR